MDVAVNEATQERVQKFGMALRIARVGAGMHQGEVAKHLKLHATAVSQMERGDRTDIPDERTVMKLEEFLNADGKLAAAAGLKLSADKRRKPQKLIELDVSDLTTTQAKELQRVVDLMVKGYRSK